MFCQQCGLRLPEGAKFCAVCGTPVAQNQSAAAYSDSAAFPDSPASQWQTAFERAKTTEQEQRKKRLRRKIIAAVSSGVAVIAVGAAALGIISAYRNDVRKAQAAIETAARNAYNGVTLTSFERVDGDLFRGTASVERSGKLMRYSGTLEIEATKEDEGWEATITADTVEVSFEENDNYYLIVPEFGGNASYLVRLRDITDSGVTVEYYSHDLEMYGNNRFDFRREERYLQYNTATGAAEFDFAGYWRIYENYIEYRRYEIKSGYGEKFDKVEPVDPNDYWWFDEAKRQAEN